MYNVERRIRKFNTDVQEDLDDYSAILSDPCCCILSEKKEKLREETYDEGKLVGSQEHVMLLVTWEEKVVI